MGGIAFRYENINDMNCIIYDINDMEKINKLEYNMMLHNKIPGFLNISYSSIDGSYSYKYDISSKVTLKKYLNRCRNGEKVIKIITNILSILLETEEYLISKEHIILDIDYIFAEVSDASLYFICIPIDDVNNLSAEKCNVEDNIFLNCEDKISDFSKKIQQSYSQSLKILINDIMCSVNVDEIDNKNALYFVKTVLDTNEYTDIKDILNIIKEFETKNYTASDIKPDEKIEKNLDHIEGKVENRNIRKIIEEGVEIKKNCAPVEFLIPGQSTSLPSADSEKKPKNESKLKSLFNLSKHNKKLKNENKKIELTKISEKTCDEEQYNHTVLIKNSANNEQTVLLSALNSGIYQAIPHLIRKKTGEKINITSSLFRIGKEDGYVDYAVKDNSTISRAHADIIAINDIYYIQDNNSKNHTYVNGTMACDGKAVKLENGYEIKLSDEVFIFKLY